MYAHVLHTQHMAECGRGLGLDLFFFSFGCGGCVARRLLLCVFRYAADVRKIARRAKMEQKKRFPTGQYKWQKKFTTRRETALSIVM